MIDHGRGPKWMKGVCVIPDELPQVKDLSKVGKEYVETRELLDRAVEWTDWLIVQMR